MAEQIEALSGQESREERSALERNEGLTEYSVRVAVRVRPLLAKEAQENPRECVNVQEAVGQVAVGKDVFTFDHVFDGSVAQERIHEEVALPLLEGLGQGLNVTLLAYGQTSAGKTYTLGSGTSKECPDDQQGIIPRFVNALFRDLVYTRQAEAEVSVKTSFVELHNEDINDLLDPTLVASVSNTPRGQSRGGAAAGGPIIREDPTMGVQVIGTKEVEVRRPSELLRCLEKGSLFRTTASTQMNDQSSRSHAIFSIFIEQRVQATGDTFTAKVRFADLAGSERVKKAGTAGERFREGVSINQGLLALGNVISALGDPKLQRSHVPYRDSKLTRMLQDSLGGNSRTLMIACVSPAGTNMAETLNTLKYANRAKNIKNKVTANTVSGESEVVRLRNQVQELQQELQGLLRSGEDGPASLLELSRLRRTNEELERENQQLRSRLKDAAADRQQAAKHVAGGAALWDSSSLEGGTGAGLPAAICDGQEPGPTQPVVDDPEEVLAHAEEEAREEACYRSSQAELGGVAKDLEHAIKEKERLAEQLLKQNQVFQSMKSRYELRLQQLQEAANQASEERERYLRELQQLEKSKEKGSEDSQKRRAQLEGRLHETSRQLTELKRRQAEAQRLLRLRQQQETQMNKMQDEIGRLKGQHQVVVSRMKLEEQQHVLWKKRWADRVKELSKQGMELRRQQRQQDKLLVQKTREAERSARKVEEMKREQKGHLQVSVLKMQLDRQVARSAKVQAANERLQRALLERDQRVEQLEAMVTERDQLATLGDEGSDQLQEVQDRIESLDAQLQFDSQCIVESQTDILRLTVGDYIPESKSISGEHQHGLAEAPLPRVAEVASASSPIVPLTEEQESADALVARIASLEESRAFCLVCLQAADELRADNSRLCSKVEELEADVSQRGEQLEELQARERVRELQWAEQESALQRLHLGKEVYLLGQVDRNLAEAHGLEGVEAEAAEQVEGFERLLRCRTEQVDLLTQENEQLQASLELATRGHAEAAGFEMALTQQHAAALAEAEQRAQQALDRLAEMESLQAARGEIDQAADVTTSDAEVEPRLRAALLGQNEEGSHAGVKPEVVAARAAERLTGLWEDVGASPETQQQRLHGLLERLLRFYASEVQRAEAAKSELEQRLAQLTNLERVFGFGDAGQAAVQDLHGELLHAQTAALEAAAKQALSAKREELRNDLAEMLNLPSSALAGVTSSQLSRMASECAEALPSKSVSEHVLMPRDLDVLGLSGRSVEAKQWLHRPSEESFRFLAERQDQVQELLLAAAEEQRGVDNIMQEHAQALGAEELQKREDFLRSRGRGLPALAASRRELRRQQHCARLRVAEARLLLTEQWTQLSTPIAEQEAVLSRLRGCSDSDSLDELAALEAETGRLVEVIDGRHEILQKLQGYAELEKQIQEFEREASDVMRLRGSSVKLLQEEQTRLRFSRRKAKVIEELVGRIAQWEAATGERFIHEDTFLKEKLANELEETRQLGGLSMLSSQPYPLQHSPRPQPPQRSASPLPSRIRDRSRSDDMSPPPANPSRRQSGRPAAFQQPSFAEPRRPRTASGLPLQAASPVLQRLGSSGSPGLPRKTTR